jgi:hypothetical protein
MFINVFTRARHLSVFQSTVYTILFPYDPIYTNLISTPSSKQYFPFRWLTKPAHAFPIAKMRATCLSNPHHLHCVTFIIMHYNLLGRHDASKCNYSPTFQRPPLPLSSGNHEMAVLCFIYIYIKRVPLSVQPLASGDWGPVQLETIHQSRCAGYYPVCRLTGSFIRVARGHTGRGICYVCNTQRTNIA